MDKSAVSRCFRIQAATASLLRKFTCLATVLATGLAGAQESTDTGELEQRNALRRQLLELEASFGRHDPSLVENLVSLARTESALNLFSQASYTLDRAIQIQRRNFGLYAAEQIPLLFTGIENDVRAGNWDRANQSLAHLSWLLLEKNAGRPERLIGGLTRLGGLHLLGVAGDQPAERARHFQRAAEFGYIALELSGRFWGEFDPRRIDLQYSLIKQLYLQSAAVRSGGETGYALRAVVPGSNWVRPRRVMQARFYRAGRSLFEQMRTILRASSDNPVEALAMLRLYEADWQLLFNQPQVESAYGEAFKALENAGLEQEVLNRLFARPQILPIAAFQGTAGEALAKIEEIDGDPESAPVSELAVRKPILLRQWYESVPLVLFPETAPQLGQWGYAPAGDLLIRFRLDALDQVSRWVGGTYMSRRSVASEFFVLENDAEEPIDPDLLRDRLHLLHFRPGMRDGIALASEGILRYRLP